MKSMKTKSQSQQIVPEDEYAEFGHDDEKDHKHEQLLTDSDTNYWKVLGTELAQKKLKHQSLDFDNYVFTEEDKEGHWKELIARCDGPSYEYLYDAPKLLVDFEQNKRTGEQFLRVVLTDKKHSNGTNFVSIKWMEIFE